MGASVHYAGTLPMSDDGGDFTTDRRGRLRPFDNLIFKQAPAWNGTINVTSALSSTLTNEFIFGASQNNLTLDPTVENAASYSGIGFNFALPFSYPANQWFNII